MNDVLHKKLVSPSDWHVLPFKIENDAATIFWALANASLGAYIAFTLLSHSKEREESLKRRIVWIVLASLALTFGCCACQLSTARIHLQGDSGTFISFKIGLIILSVFVAALSIVSAFSLFSIQSGRGESLRRSIAFKSCACSLLVGLSVGFMHYLPFLSLPSFKATFSPTQICLVLFLVISGSLFSLLVLTFLTSKFSARSRWPAYILLHAFVSLVFGSCIIGAGVLTLSGIRFEPKGSPVLPEGPSEAARKERDVLTRVVPVIISVILACSAVFLTFTAARTEPKHRSRRLYAHAYPISRPFHPIPPPTPPRLTLTSIAFGADGRILVNQKGMLPMQSVNLEGLPEDILDELDSSRSSSTFHWLIAIAFDWTVVSPFLRRISSSWVRIHVGNSPWFSSSSFSPDEKRRSLWYSIFPNVFHMTRNLLARFSLNGKSQSLRSASSSGAVLGTASATEVEGQPTAEEEEEEEVLIRAQVRGKLRLRLLEASSQLAAQLDLPLEKLGMLHDCALETGSRIGIAEFLNLSQLEASFVRDTNLDVQAEGDRFKPGVDGRGLMLFFVRFLPQQHPQEQQGQQSRSQALSEADRSSDPQRPRGFKGTIQEQGEANDTEATDLRTSHRQEQGERQLPSHISYPAGFKMRFMGRFRDALAETTGAKPEDVDKVLNGCKNTATRKSGSVLEAGCTYVSLFVERVSCDGSSEVLVYDFARHQLPSYRLDLSALTKEMRDWLNKMSGFAASDIIDICKDEAKQGRLSTSLSGGHTFACDWEDAQHERLDRERECEVGAALINFKEALAKALDQLLSDMCFVGESLETLTYLTPHVLDVPSIPSDSDTRGSGSSSGGPEPAPPAHMIIFHAEIPDPLDAELLEGESDFTHFSSSSASANHHTQAPQMPSVFEFIPRTLFDVVHALAVSQPAREAFRVEATRELEWLTSDEYARAERSQRHTQDRRLANDAVSRDGPRGGGRAPGRLSRALVSSFSIDSLSDEEGATHRSAGTAAITARVKKSWEAVKTRARTLSLSARSSSRHERGSRKTRKVQIPLSSSTLFAQSASRTNLLSHTHTGSSSTSMTATTTRASLSTKTRTSEGTSYSIPIPNQVSEPQPVLFSNPYSHSQRHLYLHSRSAVELPSGSRSAARATRTTDHRTAAENATRNTTLNTGVPLPELRSRLDNPSLPRGRSRGQSRSRDRSQSRSRKSRWLEAPGNVPIPIPVPLPVNDTSSSRVGVMVPPLPTHHKSLAGERSRRSVIYSPGSISGSGLGSGYGDRRSVATRASAFRSTPDVTRNSPGSFF